MNGDFFAIGKPQWTGACELGMNPAVAFLVLARGTGRDNRTTRWSAEAVAKHAGITWRRAAAALTMLDGNPSIVTSITRKGGNPARKLTIPKEVESRLWLPNALVTGAGSEVPPITKLRQAQNREHLQAFIELYGVQDLAGDGGLPRSLVRAPFKRTRICEAGQFTVWGFVRDPSRTCWNTGPLERFHGRKEGKESASWAFLTALEDMGMLERVDYLAESDDPEAELIHALTGDGDALAARDAALNAAESLPEEFQYATEKHDYVIPVHRHMQRATVVGVSRLVYRPHTKLTGAWYARNSESCRQYKAIYTAIAAGDYRMEAAA